MIRLFSATILLVVFSSCSENEQLPPCQLVVPEMKLTQQGALDIPYEGQYFFYHSSTYIDDTVKWLAGVTPDSKLEVIDLVNKNQVAVLSFEGPDDIYINDFYFHRPDSIFLFSEEDYKMYLVDINGNIHRKYSFATAKYEELHFKYESEGIEAHMSRISYDSINQLFYIPTIPAGDDFSSSYFDKKFVLIYDLKSEDFIDMVGRYPDFYGEQVTTTITADCYSIIPVDATSFYISFAQSPYIYHYDWKEDKNLKTFCVDADLSLGGFRAFAPTEYEVKSYIKYTVQANRFYRLKKWAQGYFMIQKLPREYLRDNGTGADVFDADFVVYFFNQEMETIGKKRFNGGKYMFYQIYPYGEMLLFSKDHVQSNQEDLEDYLQYDIYEIDLNQL